MMAETYDAPALCMIVKNEERHIARCLDSARDLSRELIVVDTGSTDATTRIAADYGAKVLPFDFGVVDFAAARNYAIEHAESPFILMLDADETLHAESVPLVKDLVTRNDNAGYYLERINRSSDKAHSTLDYVARLFPNRPYYRYQGRVHEIIDNSILANGGKLHKSNIRIDHDFCTDAQSRRRKNHWYIEILKEEIAANPGDHSRLDFLAAEYHQLEMFDEAVEIAETIARVRPTDPRAHLFSGIYHMLHKPDLVRARLDFHEALRLRPDYAEAAAFLQIIEAGNCVQPPHAGEQSRSNLRDA